jgi:selenocysteine lyase/cysteine desulfurase
METELPCVYLTPYEHHSNILPWVAYGCKINFINSDNNSNLNLESFKQKLIENKNNKF